MDFSRARQPGGARSVTGARGPASFGVRAGTSSAPVARQTRKAAPDAAGVAADQSDSLAGQQRTRVRQDGLAHRASLGGVGGIGDHFRAAKNGDDRTSVVWDAAVWFPAQGAFHDAGLPILR